MLATCYCPFVSAQDSTETMIDKLLSAQFKPDLPGATVLAARGGRIMYHKAFGMAHLELSVPSDTGMRYYIASNTKQFTAVAILQLMEKGLLSLADSLGKFVASKPPVSKITIRQLLSHTSGLNGEGYTDSLNVPKGTTRQAEIERYAAHNIDFAAGSKWGYNNANFQTLGFIIEKLSGKTYAEYMDEHIFKPAGMTKTLVITSDEPLIKGRTAGYDILRRGIINTNLWNKQGFYASGGILSTAMDMYKWNQALKSGKLLQKKTLQLAFQPQILSTGQTVPYGFGFYIDNLKGNTVYRHGGALPGFISETFYLPSADIYVVILINAESAVMPQVLARLISAELAGKPYTFQQSTLPRRYIGNYSGVYESDRNEKVNITEADGKVYWQRLGGRKYEIRQSLPDQFYFDQDFLWVEFQRDKRNKVISLVFSRSGYMPGTWKKADRPVMNLPESGKEL